MTLSTIGLLAALGGFATVYVACATHPQSQKAQGSKSRRDEMRAGH